jgi:hypothetical protein
MSTRFVLGILGHFQASVELRFILLHLLSASETLRYRSHRSGESSAVSGPQQRPGAPSLVVWKAYGNSGYLAHLFYLATSFLKIEAENLMGATSLLR